MGNGYFFAFPAFCISVQKTQSGHLECATNRKNTLDPDTVSGLTVMSKGVIDINATDFYAKQSIITDPPTIYGAI